MTFPIGTVIDTTNVASSSSDPSLARGDIYSLILAFNQLIASVNAASGVAVLDATGKLTASNLPGSYSVSGDIQLIPSTGIVNIQSVLRLATIYVADLGNAIGTGTPTAGDLIYLVDGDAGSPCLGVYDGIAWKVVRLMTQVGSVGANLTIAATLVGAAD